MTTKRLIEVSLPLAAISVQSAREKSIRHGHISTLHIWWARRPLAAMRAAIFASLIPDPGDEKERQKLEDLIAIIVDWDQVKNGNSPKIEEAKALIRQAFPDGPPKLLDPFMGGGSTGLEALRLGCETHAIELNPVAHLIELCTLVYPQKYGQPEKRKVMQGAMEVEAEVNPLAEDVRKWGEWVLEQAREEIGHLYENPEGDGKIVGYLWARTVKCPNPTCGAEMPLVRQWWLANSGNRKIALQPVIEKESKRVSFKVVELGRGKLPDFDPSLGTSSRGNATCLVCNQVANVEYVREEGCRNRMQKMPLAVIFNKSNSGKDYRLFSDRDAELFQHAASILNETQSDDLPTEPISYLSGRMNVYLYGMRNWETLFNTRQKLSLITFCRQIRSAYAMMLKEGIEVGRAKAITTYLGIALDKLADCNSSLTRWVSQGEFIANTFSRQSIPMIWDYPEVNPFSGSTGDWSGALDWSTRVIEHVSKASNAPATVHQGTATRQSYADNSFDAVITDPPYYDAVPYADMSDFFYVWLKRSVGFLYQEQFRTPLTPKSAEITHLAHLAEHHSQKDQMYYEREMTRAFAEACRILKSNGIFVVVFAHKSTSAWETLLNSLLDAGLVVTASWPLHTERPGRPIAQDSAALASSIFIVCRPRVSETEGYFDDVREELTGVIRERLDYFWKQGIRGADFFISAIGPAVSVFGRYRKVYRLDGSEVGVGELLELVQAMVSEYALDRILNGNHAQVGVVDPATRYYILHRWAYGQEKIPFDDGMRLAMALGADVSTLMDRRGILKQSAETVSLLGPKERGDLENLGLPDRTGRVASIIDVLHRAASLWEKGDRLILAEFLAEAARGREERVRIVAQTLINVLPDDDYEGRLLDNFLKGRDVLPDAPRQERLL